MANQRQYLGPLARRQRATFSHSADIRLQDRALVFRTDRTRGQPDLPFLRLGGPRHTYTYAYIHTTIGP